MLKERIEYKRYSKEQITEALKFVAKLDLIGSIYCGKIGEQETRWLDDGSLEILTRHTPVGS